MEANVEVYKLTHVYGTSLNARVLKFKELYSSDV